jgi:hypothetical protein
LAKIRPSSAKAKGRKWQQNVASLIQKVFNLHEDDVVSRPMGSGGVDLMMSKKAQEVVGISFECKKTTTEPTLTALEQARHNAYMGTVGVVAWQPRGVGGESGVVTLDLAEFLDLIKRLSDLAEKETK